MKFLYTILLIGLLPFYKLAAAPITYTGHIMQVPAGTYLVEKETQKTFRLTGDSSLNKDLKRLRNNDQINFDGIPVKAGQVRVIGINYVGLNSLLGTWKSKNLFLFDFQNFEKLYLFSKNDLENDNKWQSYHYSISPSADNKWAILLVNNSVINVGYLNIKENTDQAELEIVDPNTGTTEDTFQLQKLK